MNIIKYKPPVFNLTIGYDFPTPTMGSRVFPIQKLQIVFESVPSLGRLWIDCNMDVFFAKSHDKSASNGVGGSVKRMVTRCNL
jgi:hypothetical protein